MTSEAACLHFHVSSTLAGSRPAVDETGRLPLIMVRFVRATYASGLPRELPSLARTGTGP